MYPLFASLRLLCLATISVSLLAAAPVVAEDEDPVQVRNVRKQQKGVRASFDELKAKLDKGMIHQSSIEFLRVSLHDYYKNVIRGGDSGCTPCMKHASWKDFKATYVELDKNVRAMEEEYLLCKFALKIDGSMVSPSVDWTWDQWSAKVEKASSTTARCWLINNPEKFY